MPVIVDSQNVVSSVDTAPDGLRAEIGSYFSIQQDRVGQPSSTGFAKFNTNVAKSFIWDLPTNQNVLIPVKKSTITFTGKEDAFRDQTQWREYVNSIVSEGSQYLDHQFNLQIPEITNSFHKNYHNPTYEDLTKQFDSNSLLNYNLVSYPYKDKDKTIQKLGDIKTTFDDASGFVIQGPSSLMEAMDQFENRLLNYSGSVSEVSTKQRNIFDLQKVQRVQSGPAVSSFVLDTLPTFAPSAFPYFYMKKLPQIESNVASSEFKRIMNDHGKTKNIFQSIKQDLGFLNRNFNIGIQTQQVTLYDLITIMTSNSIASIQQASDETFLVPENEVGFGSRSQRFAEKVSAARFLSEMRKFINANARRTEQVLNSESCQTFFLGYKIEKYLDNDATEPIQTYYTNDFNFIDTQLKYGRKYIYKTKVLIGVLGSSYVYSNLFISEDEATMSNNQGTIASLMPSDFARISSEKFRAYVDVEVSPSFKVVEYQIDEDEVAFMDAPTLPPQVDVFNRKDRDSIQMRFSPNFFRVESVTDGTNKELMRSLEPLTSEDQRKVELLKISKNSSVQPDYFTGIYEIYRTRKPPQKQEDFADSYLTTIDDKTSYVSIDGNLPETNLDNMNGHFEDYLMVNEKYYYAFRAMTYHGTPSNLTIPYEIELLRDSDEYKVKVSQYKYPMDKNYVFEKKAKRILKITPNIERLLFSEEESASQWKLDEGSLVEEGITKTFKIRVTSKHTGKKMDLNINFKLSKDDSFYEN
mgnify:CR=1 FL=1